MAANANAAKCGRARSTKSTCSHYERIALRESDVPLDFFDISITMEISIKTMSKRDDPQLTTRYADMLSAMGAEPRLRIVRLLLSAHPDGMVVGEISNELDIPSSTLSHHLDKLKNENLVRVRREGTYLWYSANTESLEELLGFLYAECCTRNKAIAPEKIVCCK